MMITMAPKMPEIMSEFSMASQWVKELSVESLKYISHRLSQLISCSSRKYTEYVYGIANVAPSLASTSSSGK
jgi:hypothetical protein